MDINSIEFPSGITYRESEALAKEYVEIMIKRYGKDYAVGYLVSHLAESIRNSSKERSVINQMVSEFKVDNL